MRSEGRNGSVIVLQRAGKRTCVRPFMEVACNPLNGELLKQENTGTNDGSQQNFCNDVKRVGTLIAAVCVPMAGDDGQIGHPDSNCPGE